MPWVGWRAAPSAPLNGADRLPCCSASHIAALMAAVRAARALLALQLPEEGVADLRIACDWKRLLTAIVAEDSRLLTVVEEATRLPGEAAMSGLVGPARCSMRSLPLLALAAAGLCARLADAGTLSQGSCFCRLPCTASG